SLLHRDSPVESQHIYPGSGAVAFVKGSGIPRKADDRHIREAASNAADDFCHRTHTPAFKTCLIQNTSPGIKNLHCIHTRLDLSDEVFGRTLCQFLQQQVHCLRRTIAEYARRRLVGRAVTSDHVGGYRPWSSAEADQGRFIREFDTKTSDGLIDRLKRRVDIFSCQFGNVTFLKRCEDRSAAVFEAKIPPQSMGDNEDIGEED